MDIGDELPDGWRWGVLDDIKEPSGRAIVSGPFGSNIGSRFFVETGIPVIRGNNLTEDFTRFIDEGFVFITKEKADELKSCEAIADDIVITAAGSLGQIGIIPQNGKFPKYIISNKQLRARLDKTKVDPIFAFYWFSSLLMVEYIKQRNTGSSVPLINLSILRELPIPLPPLPTQHAISRILGSLDDKIELNRQMNETLEAMARAIFKSWFVDFDPVRAKAEGLDTGLPSEIAALFPDGFEEVDGREVPRGWGVGTVQDLCASMENGGTPKRMESTYWDEGTIPWFKTGELTDDPLIDSDEKITELGLSESACRLWHTKTILIALYASPTVGRLGILEIPGTANQACSALVAKPAFGFLFLYYSLLFSRDQLQNIAVGAAQQNINQQVLKEHRILIPDASVAQKFQLMIERLYEKKVKNIQQSRTLAQIRDALLPKLMSGEIQIEGIEI